MQKQGCPQEECSQEIVLTIRNLNMQNNLHMQKNNKCVGLNYLSKRQLIILFTQATKIQWEELDNNLEYNLFHD